jgi:hypothetical protein
MLTMFLIQSLTSKIVVTATAQYAIDLDNYYTKSLILERPFYSPLAQWAGGIIVGQQFKKIV